MKWGIALYIRIKGGAYEKDHQLYSIDSHACVMPWRMWKAGKAGGQAAGYRGHGLPMGSSMGLLHRPRYMGQGQFPGCLLRGGAYAAA